MNERASKVVIVVVFIATLLFFVVMVCSCNREQATRDFVERIDEYPEVSRVEVMDGRVIVWINEPVSIAFDREEANFRLAFGVEVELRYEPPVSP